MDRRDPDEPVPNDPSGAIWWRPGLWIGCGLLFLAVSWILSTGPRSPFWFAELPLYALMIAGLRTDRLRLPVRGWPAAVIFVLLSWAFGMTYELSLTVDGTGIGGIHPDTRASFLLAQGDYGMIAVVSCLLIRWLHLDFRGAFFLAGGMSLTEGLIFSGVLTEVIASPHVYVAPFFLAYYATVYATFVALPLVLVAPQALWRPDVPLRRVSIPALWLIGFVMAFVIRVIWGLGWAPLATAVFDLPPNPLP